MNGFSVALQSGSILLREGLEAMLIVTALAAALRKGGLEDLRPLWAGALAAIGASIVAAIIFQLWFDGAHNDFMEAIVMLVAAGLMLYMSGWLFLRQDPRAWKRMIDAHAAQALSKGTATSLAAIAFLAVFREGAETALFLNALASANGGWGASVLMGLGGAALALAIMYFVMQTLAMRIPLRPLFIVTSAFLFLMGLRFIGGAIQELQEQQIAPYDAAPLPDWFAELGFNPTWEAIGVQVIVALLACASIFLMRPRQTQAGAR
ncbi:MAG: FTR1 family protein [Beijerinckiaceae bacterium]|nr:FTR1 family protein [Beijerinckiaceae bacterium]